MLLQEMGVNPVQSKYVENFSNGLSLTVHIYKAHVGLPTEADIFRNISSSLQCKNLNFEGLNLHEDMKLWNYYYECLVHFVKNVLNVDSNQIKNLTCKMKVQKKVNSFRLLEKLLKLLTEDLQFTNKQILDNSWLLQHHPEYAELVMNILKQEYPDLPFNLIIQKNPKFLECDQSNLIELLSSFKKYSVTEEMIKNCPLVLNMQNEVFVTRVDHLSKISFTCVFFKHPKFLLLVYNYNIIMPRIQFLNEKNIKYASIHTLTSYVPVEVMTTAKKTRNADLHCFFKSQFGDDGDKLLIKFKKHSYAYYVPLVRMFETLDYLKKIFPWESITKNIYAILYDSSSIKEAYESLTKDDDYKNWESSHLLALCIYKIEQKCHFTGEGVLTTTGGKLTDCVKKEAGHD